jgi:hypothetical protein
VNGAPLSPLAYRVPPPVRHIADDIRPRSRPCRWCARATCRPVISGDRITESLPAGPLHPRQPIPPIAALASSRLVSTPDVMKRIFVARAEVAPRSFSISRPSHELVSAASRMDKDAARSSGPAMRNHCRCADSVRTASLLRADMIFGKDRTTACRSSSLSGSNGAKNPASPRRRPRFSGGRCPRVPLWKHRSASYTAI